MTIIEKLELAALCLPASLMVWGLACVMFGWIGEEDLDGADEHIPGDW